jgi:hypothetical protein
MEDIHRIVGFLLMKIFDKVKVDSWRLFDGYWKTVAENLKDVKDPFQDQDVIKR